MKQCSTLLFTYENFGDEGEISLEEPESYSLKEILPLLPSVDIRDEVVQDILQYARSVLTLERTLHL